MMTQAEAKAALVSEATVRLWRHLTDADFESAVDMACAANRPWVSWTAALDYLRLRNRARRIAEETGEA